MLLCLCVDAQNVPGQFPEASTRLLTSEDIQNKCVADLKLMRNEIFARYGHIFKSEDLKKHFTAQPWYKPLQPDVTNKLTSLEKTNITFIKSWEERADFSTFFSVVTKAISNDDQDRLISLLNKVWYGTPQEFLNSYEIHRDDLIAAIESEEIPRARSENEFDLWFGEFYSGTQSKWLVLTKSGCFWYLESIQRAG